MLFDGQKRTFDNPLKVCESGLRKQIFKCTIFSFLISPMYYLQIKTRSKMDFGSKELQVSFFVVLDWLHKVILNRVLSLTNRYKQKWQIAKIKCMLIFQKFLANCVYL